MLQGTTARVRLSSEASQEGEFIISSPKATTGDCRLSLEDWLVDAPNVVTLPLPFPSLPFPSLPFPWVCLLLATTISALGGFIHVYAS